MDGQPLDVVTSFDPARLGDWLQTFTGKKFYPLDPRPEDINLDDIAHALSNICRYGGHASTFYSVAQHSCLLADHFAGNNILAAKALLHDAAEAYLGDIVRPLKYSKGVRELFLPAFDKLERMIFEKYGLSPELPEKIKQADSLIIWNEAQDLMDTNLNSDAWTQWQPGLPGVRVSSWGPILAKREFLTRAHNLLGGQADY